MIDTIVESIVRQFKKRSEIGVRKYGTTLNRNSGDFSYWMEHLKQELMDATLYIERIKNEPYPCFQSVVHLKHQQGYLCVYTKGCSPWITNDYTDSLDGWYCNEKKQFFDYFLDLKTVPIGKV